MSLKLSYSLPEKLTAKTSIGNVVFIGDYQIPMDDFCCLVDYVMTNSDIYGPNDPRLKLIERMSASRIVDGFNAIAGVNPESKRIVLGD